MKLTLLAENLVPKLSVVSKIAVVKSALPILETILLSAENGKLSLSATDLETGVTTWLGAKIEGEGRIAVPARIFTPFCSSLSGKITLSLEKNTLVVAGEGVYSRINGADPSDFPSFPQAPKEFFEVGADVFKKAVSLTTFAAAHEEGKPVLTGILLSCGGKALTVVGVDGFRLSEKKIPLAKETEPFSAVVPAKSIAEVGRIAEGEAVKISHPKEGQVIFELGDFIIFSQTLEGDFPAYQQIIPANFRTKLKVGRRELLAGVNLVSIFGEKTASVVNLAIHQEKKTLKLSSEEKTFGEVQKEIPIAGGGEDLEIAFSSHYLSDILNALEGEEVILSLNSSLDPAVFTDPKDPAFLHVIMPVRLQEEG